MVFLFSFYTFPFLLKYITTFFILRTLRKISHTKVWRFTSNPILQNVQKATLTGKNIVLMSMPPRKISRLEMKASCGVPYTSRSISSQVVVYDHGPTAMPSPPKFPPEITVSASNGFQRVENDSELCASPMVLAQRTSSPLARRPEVRERGYDSVNSGFVEGSHTEGSWAGRSRVSYGSGNGSTSPVGWN